MRNIGLYTVASLLLGVAVNASADGVTVPGIPLVSSIVVEEERQQGNHEVPQRPLSPQALPSAGVPRAMLEDVRPSELQALQMLVAAAQQQVGGSSQTAQIPPPELTVKPGQPEIFAISRGNLNRLITPFQSPIIKTISDAKISEDGGVIYIATDSTNPITMYVMEEGVPEQAMSLTLLPRDVPPVETRLFLEGRETRRPASRTRAEDWETNQPYVSMIKSLFRTIASGKVPDGYGWSVLDYHHPLMPNCFLPGVDLHPAQVLDGANVIVFVARAVNATIDPVEIDESGCAARGVLAVAAWPDSLIHPGYETELYIAVRRDDMTPPPDERPTVLRAYNR
jgi:conjugal transfer pilus assembly protein TraK